MSLTVDIRKDFGSFTLDVAFQAGLHYSNFRFAMQPKFKIVFGLVIFL